MKSRYRVVSALLIGLMLLLVQTRPAEAAIHVYKVTFTSTALFFPKLAPNGNSRKSTGYLIYDTVNPGNSQAIELLPNKTYRAGNNQLLQLIFPSQIGVAAIDRSVPQDGFSETASALVAFQTGNSFVARAYIGAIPKKPFKIGTIAFQGIAKSLKGSGSVTTTGVDNFKVSDKWTFDALSALPGVAASNNTSDGVAAVKVFLQSKRFTEVP